MNQVLLPHDGLIRDSSSDPFCGSVVVVVPVGGVPERARGIGSYLNVPETAEKVKTEKWYYMCQTYLLR